MDDPYRHDYTEIRTSELDQLRRQNEAMREALLTCRKTDNSEELRWDYEFDEAKVKAALSPDAGSHLLTPEQVNQAYAYACRLFKHYAPQCECLPDLMGVISQLDNLLYGMVWKEQVWPLVTFARDCAENWDCDNNAHCYHTPCRKCEAKKALAHARSRGLL